MYAYLYNIIIPKLTVSGGPKEESMVVYIYIYTAKYRRLIYGVLAWRATTIPPYRNVRFPVRMRVYMYIHLCCSASSSKLILIIHFYGPARYCNLLQSFYSNYNTFFLKFQISNFRSCPTSDYSKYINCFPVTSCSSQILYKRVREIKKRVSVARMQRV